jgi:hypothetical protein
MVEWSYEVERRRGKRVAITALARKLAGMMFAVWRDASVYDPGRGAKAVTRPTNACPYTARPPGADGVKGKRPKRTCAGAGAPLDPILPDGDEQLSGAARPRSSTERFEERLSREGDRAGVRQGTTTSSNRLRPLDGLRPMRHRARILD